MYNKCQRQGQLTGLQIDSTIFDYSSSEKINYDLLVRRTLLGCPCTPSKHFPHVSRSRLGTKVFPSQKFTRD